MKFRYAWLFAITVFATTHLFAQSKPPAVGAEEPPTSCHGKSFPINDLENWRRTSQEPQDATITQAVPGPVRFGDIIVQSNPVTLSLVVGQSEDLTDPASGDRVRRYAFINTGEFTLFEWECPTGSQPRFVLLKEDGTLSIGERFTVVPNINESTLLLLRLKVVLQAADGTEIVSRTIIRKPEVLATP